MKNWIIACGCILAVAVIGVLGYFVYRDIVKPSTPTETCSEQASYDTLLSKYVTAQNTIKELNTTKANLETELASIRLRLAEIENDSTLSDDEKDSRILALTNEKLLLTQEKTTLETRISSLQSQKETLEAELEILQIKYDAFNVNEDDIDLYLAGKLINAFNSENKYVIFYTDTTTTGFHYVLIEKGTAIGNRLPNIDTTKYMGWKVVYGETLNNKTILFSELATYVPTSNMVLTPSARTSVIPFI